jgi:hypothetical protein
MDNRYHVWDKAYTAGILDLIGTHWTFTESFMFHVSSTDFREN